MDWLLINFILCLSLALLLWIRKRRERFSVFKHFGIPGPEPNFLTGNFNDFMLKREACLPEYYQKYGKVFGCFIGAKPFLVVADPEIIKMIQIKDFKLFTNRDLLLPDSGIPHPSASLSMPIAKDDEWKRVRTIVSPSFSSGKLKKVVPIINDCVTILLENIAEKSRKNESFDIALMYKNLNMEIAIKTEFGINASAQHGESNLFFESASLVLSPDTADVLIGISICFPETEPIPTTLRYVKDKLFHVLGLRSISTLFTVAQDVINQRRNSSERREDILQSLIDAKIDATQLSSIKDSDLIASRDYQQREEVQVVSGSEKKEYVTLSDEAIKSNALAFFIAGYDTTSTTIGFATYSLAEHQDIQDKVREEIYANIDKEADIMYEDIVKFQYLDQVLSETLRLHSFSMLVTNRVAKETMKYKGFVIPKGMTVCMPLYMLHRHPDHWPEPEKFNPDRFSPNNKTKIDPTMYQPFGNGPRNCIGMRFAQIMMKLTLARILRSYRLEKASEKEMEMQFSLFLSRPKEVLVRAIPI